MDYRIVAVSDQPELAPLVATWLLDEFRHPGSPNHEGMTARILAPRTGPEETFVLFEGDILLLEWKAESENVKVEDGIDTFVFRDGLIRVQTVRYTLIPKG